MPWLNDDDPEVKAAREKYEQSRQKTNGHDKTGTRVKLKRGSDIAMEKIDWLWPGWIARGKLHVIAGAKGAGKSTLGFDLFAKITCGGALPDGNRAAVGDVLIWSGEDDIADTILPRMAVAGADRSRIYFIDSVIVNDIKRGFDPANDMPALLDTIHDLPELRGILIDPLVLASAGDSHKNAETRRGLQPLVDVAAARDIAVLGITHFTKGTQGKEPIERITGSLAFGALPRIVFAAAKYTEDGPRRFIRIGSNIGITGGGFEYLMRQDLVVDHDFTAQRVLWGKRLEGSPVELLENSEDKSKKDKAGDLLDQLLADGPVAVADIRKAAQANDVSQRYMEDAKAKAKPAIIAEQAGKLREVGLLAEKTPARGWYWLREIDLKAAIKVASQ